jgi:GT2 family glycosyltransferase
MVDNGSPEPVPSNLLVKYPNIAIKSFALERNLGFSGGNNYAAQHASGAYLVLLNTDAFPNLNWLENIRIAIDKYPYSFFSSKLIKAQYPDRLDGEGDIYHISGLVWRKSTNKLVSSATDHEGEVFGACGAAAVYPMDAFRQVQGFDEDYFSYVEDIDLAFRLRLIGYKCIHLPNAIVYHEGSGSTAYRSDLSIYYGQRNMVWTFIKDVPGSYVWLLAPLHILTNLWNLVLAIFRKQTRITCKAKLDALLHLPAILHKREQVQETRSVPISRIMKAMDWNLLSPILKSLHR